MTDEDLRSATDRELVRRVRAGGAAAYAELFRRHHGVALRFARRFDADRAEDLCAEAFAKILDLLQRGKGPTTEFRAYLLTTVRTNHLNQIRSSARERLVPDHEPIGRAGAIEDDHDGRFDRDAVGRAFSCLPARWQSALWLTCVEGLTNIEVGRRLGISANAVASLTFRARAGLQHAFLAVHLQNATDPGCRQVLEQLPRQLRGTTSRRRRTQIDDHVRGCPTCTAAVVELSEVELRLRLLTAPLAVVGLGGAAATPRRTHGPRVAGGVGAAVAAVVGWSVLPGPPPTPGHPPVRGPAPSGTLLRLPVPGTACEPPEPGRDTGQVSAWGVIRCGTTTVTYTTGLFGASGRREPGPARNVP